MSARWNSSDLPASAPVSARSSPTKGKTQPEPREPVTAQKNQPQAEYYAHPYQLNVANGTHYPGRMRVVLVGPANEELLAALVALLNEFKSTPKPAL